VVAAALLIACVNVACLLLARASARQKEVAVRLALGAGRGRLIRQLLTESLLLAALGGVLGLLLAKSGAGFLLATLSIGDVPVRFDGRILAFTAAASALTGVLFGLAPALAGTRADLNPILKGETRSERRFSQLNLTKSLVISQVALSLSLLVGAGLLVRTLKSLYAVDTGFERAHVLQMWVFPVLNGYDHAREMNLYPQLLEKLNATPGVQSASLSRLRMIFGRWNRDVWVQGLQPRADASRKVHCDPVGPRFFETMGIALLLGREFSPADTATSSRVAVISESMARKFFPNQNPLGKHFGFEKPESSADIEIVGVVKDIKHRVDSAQPPEAAYIPYTQAPSDMYGQMNFVLRTAADPAVIAAAAREAVQSIDKNLPLVGVETQEAEIDEYLGSRRSMATLLSLFAALALLLASIGIYGTMSYAVGRRTKELGIRIALGAQKTELLSMVLGETLRLLAIGALIGIPLAMAGSRLLSGMLFAVKSTDPLTISLAVSAMGAIALLAGYLPARRATRVDPIVALRYE
jgi:predicted permease